MRDSEEALKNIAAVRRFLDSVERDAVADLQQKQQPRCQGNHQVASQHLVWNKQLTGVPTITATCSACGYICDVRLG